MGRLGLQDTDLVLEYTFVIDVVVELGLKDPPQMCKEKHGG